MRVISLWSGPRNVSTALMYSFAQRQDCEVVDEPLYAHYLSHVNVAHPGREEVLECMNKNGSQVVQAQLQPGKKPLRFLKNMAHHWINLDDDLLPNFSNIFLIRDPLEMLPSLINQIPTPVLRDTALKQQWLLLEVLQQKGERVVVIDSKQLLKHPSKILQQVCSYLAIPFDEGMLKWQSGPIQEDGIWAKYWYQTVHTSTGFQKYKSKRMAFPEHLKSLLAECQPYYHSLLDHSLKI